LADGRKAVPIKEGDSFVQVLEDFLASNDMPGILNCINWVANGEGQQLGQGKGSKRWLGGKGDGC